MAYNEIQMDPAEIKDRANRIKTRTAEIDEFLNELERKMRTLDQVWEGKASQAYVEQFMKIKTTIKQKLEENLINLSDAMLAIADRIAEADQSLANQVNGM
ncbi:WXG100 family type VII secretion target [Defluviitalea phaphyphila]|uniref:WXG100 family type VII secretion target n=1 Tax=Defluviitalea phaphyphila TaxID=1473580 RepID=UPI00073170AA|nr:WXG100 family type VII secretion target [Defluviitalea phaphyphila]